MSLNVTGTLLVGVDRESEVLSINLQTGTIVHSGQNAYSLTRNESNDTLKFVDAKGVHWFTRRSRATVAAA